MKKTCTKCGNAKSLDDFCKDSIRKDGLHPWCNSCRSASAKNRMKRPEAKESAKEASLRYYKSPHGKDKVKQYTHSREFRDRQNELQREYGKRPDVKLKRAAKSRAYRISNPEKEKARKFAHSLVAKGILKVPSVCDWCGKPGERFEIHHWLGYEPSVWLYVKFVHPSCHDECENKKPEDWSNAHQSS